MTNGPHVLSIHAQWIDADGVTIYDADSTPVSVNVFNEISFPNWFDQFGDMGNSLGVIAQSAEAPATWFLDIWDSQTNYIGTMSDTTTDGNISIVWDLTGPDGVLHLDNTFEMILTVVSATKTNSALVPPIYRKTDPWPGNGNWVVANLQAWNQFVGSSYLDGEADSWAQEAVNLGLVPRPYTLDKNQNVVSFRIPSTNAIYGAPQNAPLAWATFALALYDTSANNPRNLFYLGHGNANSIGEGGPYNIGCGDIVTNLGTWTGSTNIHRYRFVCIDGCETANGHLPEAFGIPHKTVSEATFQANSARPCAFVGWDIKVEVGYTSSVFLGRIHFFQHLLYEWDQGPVGIQQAIVRAYNNYIDNTGMQDAADDLIVYGDPLLGPTTFNR